MAKKPSLGRQKIKIVRIEKPNHRQVTFSKRRSGLFKKACELCTLCGVEIAIVVFSPANKVFSFGHPNVESLEDKFLGRGIADGAASSSSTNSNVRELNGQLTHVSGLLDGAKDRKGSLERAKQWWWETPIEKLGKTQLDDLASMLEGLKKTVTLQAQVASETTSFETNAPQPHTHPQTQTTEVYGFSGFVGNNNGFGGVVGN